MNTSPTTISLHAAAEHDSPSALLVNAGVAEQVAAKCLDLGITSVYSIWVTDYCGVTAQTNSLVDAQRLATAFGLVDRDDVVNEHTRWDVHSKFTAQGVRVIITATYPAPVLDEVRA